MPHTELIFHPMVWMHLLRTSSWFQSIFFLKRKKQFLIILFLYLWLSLPVSSLAKHTCHISTVILGPLALENEQA